MYMCNKSVINVTGKSGGIAIDQFGVIMSI